MQCLQGGELEEEVPPVDVDSLRRVRQPPLELEMDGSEE